MFGKWSPEPEEDMDRWLAYWERRRDQRMSGMFTTLRVLAIVLAAIFLPIGLLCAGILGYLTFFHSH